MNQVMTAAILIEDLFSQPSATNKSRATFNLCDTLAILQCQGEDAATFLQGQLTLDIGILERSGAGLGQALLTSCCNPQGRMIALFHLAKLDQNTFWIILPAEMVQILQSHLQKYIVFSKANLSLLEQYALCGIINASNSQLMPHCGERYLFPLNDQDPRCFLQVFLKASLTSIGSSFSTTQPPIEIWQLYWLLQGIPWFDERLSGQYLPNDLFLENHNGLSFTKGCYTGQEPIARLHYRGKAKFALYRISFIIEQPLILANHEQVALFQLADEAQAPSTPAQKIGSCLQLIERAPSKYFGLARIRIDHQVEQATFLHDLITKVTIDPLFSADSSQSPAV